MAKKHHKILERKTLFSKGPIHLLDLKVRTPHGKVLSRQVLKHPGCVVIMPRTKSGKYTLVRQYRFPIMKHLWELPAGGKEAGESFAAAARRELREEIGMAPGRMKKLLEFYPTPGVSGEKMCLYLAWDLRPSIAEKDEDEEFETGQFSLREIGRMIECGEIVDGKTLIGYYCVKNMTKE
ncbi:MAG TPA: NUDIX hydrolase [Candidatus Omnitrophota bacterium]|nr:NUDIX hydrolase [Candidatus Omnitrophota bacterium]HQB93839.1 NUDIX hydrolase [Candidatus Omnitrophota bacterium]